MNGNPSHMLVDKQAMITVVCVLFAVTNRVYGSVGMAVMSKQAFSSLLLPPRPPITASMQAGLNS